jgi:hypothetical protein
MSGKLVCPKCGLSMTRDTLTGGKCACDYVYAQDLKEQLAIGWQIRCLTAESKLAEAVKENADIKRDFENCNQERLKAQEALSNALKQIKVLMDDYKDYVSKHTRCNQ